MSTGLVDTLRLKLSDAVRPYVRGRRVALLDFPAHTNVGDSAIWLGALRLLRSLGASGPCYQCDRRTYDRRRLARRIGAGTILFTGGGSLGDLWEKHLLFREQVIRDFPGNPIVQLPESVHFQSPAALARARRTFESHPELTIMVRDRVSLGIVEQELGMNGVLAPDVALALGPIPRSGPVLHDVLWLKRRDKEDRWPDAVPPGSGLVQDWIEEPRSWRIRTNETLRRTMLSRPVSGRALSPILQAANAPAARDRLDRGVALLGSARVVVTDRLHGHILALMLGIPHVVLDNSYGKLHNFVDTWTAASPLVHLAASPEQAAGLAASLAGE